MGSLGKVSNRLEGPNCADLTFLSFFFFAAEPCFGRSRVENFQNSWEGGEGNPFPIRGKSRHRDASCKRSSKQTRKEAFPPDGYVSIRTVRTRAIQCFSPPPHTYTGTCVGEDVHDNSPWSFWILYKVLPLLFSISKPVYRLRHALRARARLLARSRRSANACQSNREHPAARGPVFAAVINNLLHRQLSGERVGALGCSIGCNQRRAL